MHPTLFKIGEFEIGSFGLLVALGFFSAYLVSLAEAKRAGLSEDRFANFLIGTLLAGLVGAKLLHVWVYLGQDSITHLLFSRSGLVFYGGLLVGIPVGFLFTRRYGWRPGQIADIAAIAIPLGHFFGRIGCFLNGCCFGSITNAPWAVRFPRILEGEHIIGSEPYSFQYSLRKLSGEEPWSLPIHPTQLYEAFGSLAIFVLLIGLSRKRPGFEGRTALLYLVLYGGLRFTVEFFRSDPRGGAWMFSTSQWISLGLLALAAVLWKPMNQRFVQRSQNGGAA